MRRLLLVAAFVAVTIALIAVGAPSNWGALGFAIAAGVFGYAFLRRTPPRDTAPVAPAPEGIAPPITIADGDDISFYATVWDVVAEYEPWYPSWSAYRAFDAEGRRLDLYADPPIVRRRVIGPLWTDNAHKSELRLRALETEPTGAEELTLVLRRALDEPGRLPLPDLLARAIERYGYGY